MSSSRVAERAPGRASSRQSRVPSTSRSGGRSGSSSASAAVERGGRSAPAARGSRAAGAARSSRIVRVRPLVREHASRLVRLGGERGDDAAALARDAVGADVVLDEKPRGRLVLALEDAVREPARGTGGRPPPPSPAASGGRRCTGSARRGASRSSCDDGVVRRRDEIGERAGRAGVADGAERLHVGHRGRAYQRPNCCHRLRP